MLAGLFRGCLICLMCPMCFEKLANAVDKLIEIKHKTQKVSFFLSKREAYNQNVLNKIYLFLQK